MELISRVIVNVNNDLIGGALKSQLEFIQGLVVAMADAKEAEVDPLIVAQQMYSDNLMLDIEGMISTRSAIGGRATIGGDIGPVGLSLGGEYGNSKQNGIRVRVAREFRTINAPHFTALASMEVEDLRSLAEQVGLQIEKLDKAVSPAE